MMLRSDRLVLRAIEPEDLDLMYLVENDTSLWQHGSANVPFSRYQLRQYIEQSSADIYADNCLKLVITTTQGKGIGFIDLQNFSPMHKRAEVGIVLLPEFKNQGYALEAMRLIMHYCTSHLHLHQLFAIVSVTNASAIKLFTSAKFKPSGTLTEWLYLGASAYADAILFSKILKD